VALLAAMLCKAADRGVPATHGIANFGQVNTHLYRGAQPDATGMANLKQLGIKTIICLRMTNDLWNAEGVEATNNGMTFINIPLPGTARPKDADVARALSVIQNSPGPVFVHCCFGCDRTGTIIACYRIQHDRWTGAEAQKEADHFGMSPFEFGMKRFIANFASKAAKSRGGTHRLSLAGGGGGAPGPN